jgi:carbon-monoxide dehydrogenase small subunit
MRLSCTVNGREVGADVEPSRLLVLFLREQLRLTGTKAACDTGVCGACTVLLDGRAVKSCTILAVQVDGGSVTTIEGLSEGGLSLVQEAFHAEHAVQCGFCTPGMVVSVTALLSVNPDPSEEEVRAALEGNLCRCTGYEAIKRAVRLAAASLAGGEPPPVAGTALETPLVTHAVAPVEIVGDSVEVV